MGKRKIIIKQSVADSIAQIAWFIESKGMLVTADKFSDAVYDFFEQIAEEKRRFPLCIEPERAVLGYKCATYRKKYTVVFIESETQITICEFISSKLIRW
ncbi:MAG TPA: hypothetical protein VJY62_05320 [Bacteroidia bacterium]|nr:hypothetical protein [Bacteroidia bacterium]